jgi:hypothetical protein
VALLVAGMEQRSQSQPKSPKTLQNFLGFIQAMNDGAVPHSESSRGRDSSDRLHRRVRGARAIAIGEVRFPSQSQEPYKRSFLSEAKELRFTCTLLALLRKSLIINGAGEGNRTLVIIQRPKTLQTPLTQSFLPTSAFFKRTR